MTYIIENANLYKNNQLYKTSLLVDNQKILSVQPTFSKYRYMKMDAKNFIMTPTNVFYCKGIPELKNYTTERNYFITQFLLKGCTTVLVSTEPIEYIYELDAKVETVRKLFSRSPLDYIIGLTIPLKLLTPELVKKCKRKKIPSLFIELNDPNELKNIPWGWIREAIFPYNFPFIPVFHNHENIEKKLTVWNAILTKEKIPHLSEMLYENKPISFPSLKKIGIYPMKGYLQVGGELTYNLYLLNENDHLHEINERSLTITVHKGDVIRAGNKVYYNPKKGEEIVIKRPSFFL